MYQRDWIMLCIAMHNRYYIFLVRVNIKICEIRFVDIVHVKLLHSDNATQCQLGMHILF